MPGRLRPPRSRPRNSSSYSYTHASRAPSDFEPEQIEGEVPSVDAAAEQPSVSSVPVDQAAEPAAIGSEPAAIESEAPIQQRMFSLRRALEAQRQGGARDEFPEFPVLQSAPAAEAELPPAPLPAAADEPPIESAPAPEAVVERKGWFGSRRKAVPIEPVVEADAGETETVAMTAAPEAATAPPDSEPEPKPEPKRRGWFGRRRKPAAEAAMPQLDEQSGEFRGPGAVAARRDRIGTRCFRSGDGCGRRRSQ